MNQPHFVNRELVVSKEKEFWQAMESAHVQKLDELLHEDLLFHLPNGQMITKEMDLEAYSTGIMKLNAHSILEQNIHVIENTAIVSTTVEMKGMYSGHPFEGTFAVLRVWKLSQGALQVVAGSSHNRETSPRTS